MKELSPVPLKFVTHWGELGTRWGINRTVAQIHALLYIVPEPLDAEQIAEVLAVARSNVSNSLRELQGWGIVKLVHLPGDRRDHFEAVKDVWELFRVVLDERRRREVDPTLAVLHECLAEAGGHAADAYTRERLQAMSDFFEATTTWHDRLRKWPTKSLVKFIKLTDKLLKAL